MIGKIKSWVNFQLRHLSTINQGVNSLTDDLKSPKVNLGKLQAHLNSQRSNIKRLSDVEFQVFSQWGDDGIIQYIIDKLEIPNKTFVEFGVENYKESNTRFLLINNNWSGLVMDGSKANVDFIRKDKISWAHELHAWQQFITKENINNLLTDFLKLGYDPGIGLLSIDVDGNDYWIWKEINVVNPVIVVVEYNSVFGLNPWTIPYQQDFVRSQDCTDPRFIFYGSSLTALCDLADEKGYYFIGCNSAGNNAYFVRKDRIGNLKPLSVKEGYEVSKFRELMTVDGGRVSGPDRIKVLNGQKIYNTATKSVESIP